MVTTLFTIIMVNFRKTEILLRVLSGENVREWREVRMHRKLCFMEIIWHIGERLIKNNLDSAI